MRDIKQFAALFGAMFIIGASAAMVVLGYKAIPFLGSTLINQLAGA